ncbi:MAG: metallophosphoesterase [Clostridiales bacterium]|nr:metallophosphoesterase [Clostridiales bacterium]
MENSNALLEKNKKVPRIKRGWLIALICAGAVLLGFFAAALLSLRWNKDITVSNYELRSEKLTESVRVVLISDLHRRKFDETNQLLVDRTAEQEPDIICVCGDMLEHYNTAEQKDELVSLFERLVNIAPVYFAPGNHDYDVYCQYAGRQNREYVFQGPPSKLRERLEATGAVFLESEYVEAEINGQSIRIGGFYPFAFQTPDETDFSFESRKTFLEDYCRTDDFKLMISHRPDSYVLDESAMDWEIDLVVCGHTHGGVVRMPFGLGAVWTNEGLFPKHDMGFFSEGNMNMVITSGLDGHGKFPRVFNPPEIAVVDLLPAE